MNFLQKHSFGLIMVGIMVSLMSAVGQLLHGHFDFIGYLLQLPLMFIIAFLLQTLVAMPLAKKITGKIGTSERKK